MRRASALVVAVLWSVTAPATAADPVAPQGRNNYYAYTDADGVLHVTNVPGTRAGAWKLWKSLEGTGRKPAAAGDEGEGPHDRMPGERQHRFDSYIRGAALRYQLPESLIRAVIHTESNFRERAVSRVGAIGLMQLMPRTARSLGVQEPFDPQQNVYGGARYLRLLANRYSGDMVLVLAAYNAGAANVDKYAGVPPFEETRAYVRSVLRRFYAYERQAQLGQQSLRREPARHIAP